MSEKNIILLLTVLGFCAITILTVGLWSQPTEDAVDKSLRLFVRDKLEQSQVDDWACFNNGSVWLCVIDTGGEPGESLLKVRCNSQECVKEEK